MNNILCFKSSLQIASILLFTLSQSCIRKCGDEPVEHDTASFSFILKDGTTGESLVTTSGAPHTIHPDSIRLLEDSTVIPLGISSQYYGAPPDLLGGINYVKRSLGPGNFNRIFYLRLSSIETDTLSFNYNLKINDCQALDFKDVAVKYNSTIVVPRTQNRFFQSVIIYR